MQMGDRHQSDRPASPAVERAVRVFAERIRELRRAAGLSQSDLGAKVGGVHWTSIARYEAGKQIPTLKVALALAETLGTTIDGLTSSKGRKR